MKIIPISKDNPYRGACFANVDPVDASRIREVRRILARLSDLTDYIDDYDLRKFGSLLIARYGQRNGLSRVILNILPRDES